MAFERGHALVVGVGAYQFAPETNIPMAVADARAVADILKDAHTCGYPPEQVRFIQDEAASKAGFLTSLETLGQQVKREDTVFLFYCGHGALGTDGNYYLVSHDAHIEGSRVTAGSGVSEAELLDTLRAIKAERMLMVFNTCFSGNISPSFGPGDEEFESSSLVEETSSALLGTGSGRIIITASRDSQKSYFVRSEPLSIFCQALVDGLRGRDVRNSSGYISAYSLYESVYEKVRERVNAIYYVDQEPELTVLKGVGPFAVALYKGASTLGEFDERQSIPEFPAVRQVKPEKAARLFSQRIDTGGGAFVGGSVNTGGGDFIGRDQTVTVSGGGISIGGSVSGSTIVTGDDNIVVSQASMPSKSLKQIYQAIEERDGTSSQEKADLKAEVAEIENEVNKGDGIDESLIARRLRNIQRMAPDISELLLVTISNPAAGFSMTARQVAARMMGSTGG